MTGFVLDTSAWLEYFNGGAQGSEVRRLLRTRGPHFTPGVVLAEIVEAARLREGNSKQFVDFVLSRTEFAPMTPEIARVAGKLSAERAHPPNAWTTIESLVLATARHHRAKILTRDPIYWDSDPVVRLAGA